MGTSLCHWTRSLLSQSHPCRAEHGALSGGRDSTFLGGLWSFSWMLVPLPPKATTSPWVIWPKNTDKKVPQAPGKAKVTPSPSSFELEPWQSHLPCPQPQPKWGYPYPPTHPHGCVWQMCLHFLVPRESGDLKLRLGANPCVTMSLTSHPGQIEFLYQPKWVPCGCQLW